MERVMRDRVRTGICRGPLKWGLAVLLWLPLSVMGCNFPPGFFYRVNIDPGHLFVGRDAPIGTIIRPQRPSYQWESTYGDLIWCYGTNRFEVTSPMPQIHGSSLVGPGEVILQTRIPGIGVVMGASYGSPGHSYWSYTPGQGRFGWGVPHTSIVQIESDTSGSGIRPMYYDYRIIKYGPVDSGMGPQSLAGHTLAEVTNDKAGKVVELVFSAGTLDTALCGLPGAPSTQVTVPMGTWRTGQFTGEGSFTDARSFSIPVQACRAGTEPGNENFAVLRLDPRNGSSVLDAPRGILGLNQDSDATGIGVQVLKPDLTPMPLLEDVPMTRLQNGDIHIPMAARYIQVGKDAPVGGVANASVAFSLTYK